MNAPRVPLSILDLVSISEGMTTREAIDASMEGAQAADRLGYERLWFAEHHNTNSLASSATALLIDRAASLGACPLFVDTLIPAFAGEARS